MFVWLIMSFLSFFLGKNHVVYRSSVPTLIVVIGIFNPTHFRSFRKTRVCLRSTDQKQVGTDFQSSPSRRQSPARPWVVRDGVAQQSVALKCARVAEIIRHLPLSCSYLSPAVCKQGLLKYKAHHEGDRRIYGGDDDIDLH